MTVKELLEVVDGTTIIVFSTDNDILDRPLYDYPYLRLKSILDKGVKKVEIRNYEHIKKTILYVEVAE